MLCQSALVAFLTGEIARAIMEGMGVAEKDIRKFQALIAGGSGIVTAAMTVDPGGALLSVIIAVLNLKGYSADASLLMEEAHQ